MGRISKIGVAFIGCSLLSISAHAALEVLQNPHNMEIAYYQTAGLENWPGWGTDTLETAYDAGQVSIMSSGLVDLGNRLNSIDGLAPDYGAVIAASMKLAPGSSISYTFNADYTGGRTLGSDSQNALRVNTFYHVDMQGFYYKLLYSTIDAPNTFHVLVEVRDPAPIAWKPRTITYDFGENSTLVHNIDTIRYEELHATNPGAVIEINVSLVTGPTTVQVDLTTQTTTVPSLYNVGYAGWSDITNPVNVDRLNEVGVKRIRLIASLPDICGAAPGTPLNLDYVTAPDAGVGFVDRITLAIANGWTPLIATSIHSAVHWLPVWFHGEQSDNNGDAWTRYDSDGTKQSGLADGNQLQELSSICQQISAGLVARGHSGLLWESTMESDPNLLPIIPLHYEVGKGLRLGDPTVQLMGPATWPGYSVQNGFLKPYLQTYGADLLDFVSVHWYSNLQLFNQVITMADTAQLSQLMDVVPKHGSWCKDIQAIIDDPLYNPTGKNIGIAFTEYDASSASAYSSKPGNPDWPAYRADADNYINTGYFGGVWNAAALCYMADSDSLDMAFKYQTIDYFGILAVANSGGDFYRTPLWYAWKLLQSKASLVEGNPMFQAQVEAPLDAKIDAFAVGDLKNPRIILINRSFTNRTVNLTLGGLGPNERNPVAQRYIFNEDRSAQFIGPAAVGSPLRGEFSDAPAISPRDIALEMVDELPLLADGNDYTLELDCGPISITVLDVVPEQVATILGGSISNEMLRLVVNVSGPAAGYAPKTTTNLMDGTWGGVAHSDDGINPPQITNLNYATLEGTNNVIYVEANGPQAFFSIGAEE